MAVEARPGRARSRRWWWWLAVAVVVAAAAALFLALRRTGPEASASAPVTATVRRAPFRVTVNGPGSLSPIRSLALAPSVAGRLAAIAAVGDRVAAGATLARLDAVPLQRAVTDAELTLQKAEASLAGLQASQAQAAATLAAQIGAARSDQDAAQRAYDSQQRDTQLTETLAGLGSASTQELRSARDALSSAQEALAKARDNLATLTDSQRLQHAADVESLANARIAVAQARLSLSAARQDLEDATLVAPFAGVVSTVEASVGEMAGTASPVLTLVDDATVILQAQIDETDIGSVADGQAATVALDAASQGSYQGKVTRIAPTATLVSNIPVFIVDVAVANADHVLKTGMTGQATIVVREVPDAFQVPARAVHDASGQAYVLVRQEDGSYLRTPVTPVGSSGINSVLTGDVPDKAIVLVSGEGAAGQGSAPSQPGDSRRPSAVPFANPGGGFRRPRGTPAGRGRSP